MKQPSRIVYGGVDTHLDVHVAAVIDDTGRLLGTKPFPTRALGLHQPQRWLAGHGQVTSFRHVANVGPVQTSAWRAPARTPLGVTWVLQAAGYEVIEVNRPNRQLRRLRGTSDTTDAVSAARSVLAGHATSIPKSRDGLVECLRVLRLADRSAKGADDPPGRADRASGGLRPRGDRC